MGEFLGGPHHIAFPLLTRNNTASCLHCHIPFVFSSSTETLAFPAFIFLHSSLRCALKWNGLGLISHTGLGKGDWGVVVWRHLLATAPMVSSNSCSTVARTVHLKTKRNLKKTLYSEVISGSSFNAHSFLYQLGLSGAVCQAFY